MQAPPLRQLRVDSQLRLEVGEQCGNLAQHHVSGVAVTLVDQGITAERLGLDARRRFAQGALQGCRGLLPSSDALLELLELVAPLSCQVEPHGHQLGRCRDPAPHAECAQAEQACLERPSTAKRTRSGHRAHADIIPPPVHVD